jgi:hypothetical protein
MLEALVFVTVFKVANRCQELYRTFSLLDQVLWQVADGRCRLALGISLFFLFHHEHRIRMITQALFYSLDYLVLIFVIHSHLWLCRGHTDSRRICSNYLRHICPQSESAGRTTVVTLHIPHCSISQPILV